MKKIFCSKLGKTVLAWVLVVCMVVPLLPSGIIARAADVLPDYNYHNMSMKEILELEDRSLTWVFAGDSITHNGSWSGGMNSYSEWFEQYLYDIGRGDDSVVLTAWGGADTKDFLYEEDTPKGDGAKADPGMGLEKMITSYNPDVVFIKLGMNDRGKTTKEFEQYYNKILDGIYQEGVKNNKVPKIVVITPTPLASENIYDDTIHIERDEKILETILRFRDKLEEIARNRGLLFCDLRTAFLEESKRLGEDYSHTFYSDSSDGGIHPNAAGQYHIFKTLAKTIGIYDETMPIFQLEYEDFLSQALYADSTDGVTYDNNYGNVTDDKAEMNRVMPMLDDVLPIASVDFHSGNGRFNGGSTYTAGTRFDLTDADKCDDPLTLEEAQNLTKEFSVVFRAKLETPNSTNQPVLFVSPNGTTNWNSAISLGVPGTANQIYYEIRNNGEKTNSTNTCAIGNNADNQSIGHWHTIAIVQSASSLTYYIDGNAYNTQNFYVNADYNVGDAFVNASSFTAHIGSYGENAGSYQLKGNFDFYQLYGEALTAQQVASLSPKENNVVSWSDTIRENNVWGVAGAQQMSGYEGTLVNRSLFRYLDNAMRGGANARASQRDIRMFNFASPAYENGVKDLLAKYDTTMAVRSYDVFLLLPEIPNVYEIGYVHSADLVAEYKNNVLELLSRNSGKVKVLWTPLASGSEEVNGYIDDYAMVIREIAATDSSVLFFDANRFMNENMIRVPALIRNWFEDGAYVSPLCCVDVAYAFYTLMNQSGIAKSELSDHNLRYTRDKQVFKGNYVRDYVKPEATVEGTKVTVDISTVREAYPDISNIRFAVMPAKGTGNYNANIRFLDEIANVSTEGNAYTFEAPCADLHLAIYGEKNGLIYRFKDISLTVNTTAVIPEKRAAEPDGIYLDSLNVMSAPDFGFDKDTTNYTVNLYQYQTYARVCAKAQAGLTITVNGKSVASNALSEPIKVEDGSKITITVEKGTETKTYTLTCAKPENPDIIITEVMQDGYLNYTASGNDNYELVEIYNASGRDLNLLDYSLGFKKDYTYNNITVSNGAEYPYYFTGNDQAFGGNATHTGIKPLTKYSIYWKDKVNSEPGAVLFPADSTMVIWVRYAPQGTQAARETYGAALTYDTLRKALDEHKGTKTLSVDVDGVETAVVPQESQLVVAELPVDSQSGGLSSRAQLLPEKAQQNWYMDNFGGYYAYQSTRGWLFILKDTATVASNGTVTAAGNDIISAAKFSRAAKDIGNNKTQGTDKLSSVFSYNHDRGMSLVKDESHIIADKIGTGNTSDVMGYSNLTSFGAIEYWQKPADFGDTSAPVITNNTVKSVDRGSNAEIRFDLTDDQDIRYAELYVRRAGETKFTKITKDFVLEAGVKNAGLSTDIRNKVYSYTIDKVTDRLDYYAKVVDGNNNVAAIGSETEPLTITTSLRAVQSYSADEALAYVGVKAPESESDGYVFAGWYADETCKTSPIKDRDEVTGVSYALFVAKDVLSVKAQLTEYMEDTDAANDATGAIRFVTTVDTLNYRNVGFKIAFDKDGDGKNTEYRSVSDKVYTQLLAVNAADNTKDTLYPGEFCDISAYFKACTVKNIAENYYELEFTVIPFWTTLDGVEVEGVSAVKVINDRIASKYEAKDNVNYYTTLEEAVGTVKTAEANTITLMRDAEVEFPMTVKADTNVMIRNREKRSVTIYRGNGLAESNTFIVEKGGILTIAGSSREDSFVFDGRSRAEAEANTDRDNATGSTGSLFYNSGSLNLTNATIQNVRKTTGTGAVVMSANAAESVIKVEDVNFVNNKAAGAGGVVYVGNNNGMSEFKNVVFMNNAGAGGAAISNYSPLTLTNCKFTGNQSSGNGGAIYNGSNAVLTILGTDPNMAVFENNKTTNGYGGAVGVGSGKVVLNGYRIVNNSASAYGGAVYITGSSEKYSEIKNSYFEGNRALANNGGAIHLQSSGRLNLLECNFHNNYAKVRGGALHVEGGKVNVSDTDFVKNTADTEGGAFRIAAGGAATFINGKFENNNGGTMGGAIKYNSGTITVENYIFTGNKATSGNNIRLNTAFGGTTPTLTGCTFDPSGIVDSTGATGTYKDGGENTIISE